MKTASKNIGSQLPMIGSLRRGLFQSLEVFAIAAIFAVSNVARADDFFAKAESAYKAGKFGEASAEYRKILDDGKFSPEVFFNLGNAEFKQGNLGEAVLNYRRAWMLSPRDPDIRANFNFAIGKAGATGPELSLPAVVLTRLTMSEWAVVAILSYWLAAACAIAFVMWRRWRGLLRAAAALVCVGVLALAGIAQWRSFRVEPEIVVKTNSQALFAPIAEGTPHFALPEGSVVRELEREGEWVSVQSGANSGWIPLKACENVYPWKNRGHT